MNTNNKVHVFEVGPLTNLDGILLMKKLSGFFETKELVHEIAPATNKENCLRFKIPSESANNHTISALTSFIEEVVGEVGTTCLGFGVPDTDLATFVEKPAAVFK